MLSTGEADINSNEASPSRTILLKLPPKLGWSGFQRAATLLKPTELKLMGTPMASYPTGFCMNAPRDTVCSRPDGLWTLKTKQAAGIDEMSVSSGAKGVKADISRRTGR